MPQDGCNLYQPKVSKKFVPVWSKFVPVWSNWHIGQHSLPVRTKYECRCLLVYTLPLDGITCVSWINTINQYNARRWVQPVAAKKVRNVLICSCLEQLTHWAALTTCKNQVWHRWQMTFSFYFATRWHHMCFMNKHHQSICHKMGAKSKSEMYVMW